MKQDVVIIGGGFSGLSAAQRLLKNGITPLLIEKEKTEGGMASCHRVNDFWIEKFYHHFFTHDLNIAALAKELGKEKNLIWNKARMGFFSKDKLLSLTTPLDLLRFGHIGFLDRFRFALFSILAKKTSGHDRLDGLSAREWLDKKIGASAYLKIVEPLIKSKFGMHADDISAAFLLGRIKARVKSRGRFLEAERFGYYAGGMQDLISEFSKKIQSGGADIMLNTEAKEIIVRGDCNFAVKTDKGEKIECGGIIATTPVPVLKGLMGPRLPGGSGFNYRSSVCLTMGVRENLSKFYWINIADDKIPFGVIVEHTNLAPTSFYGGNHIVYLSGYYDNQSPLYRANDEEILGCFTKGLRKIFPDFREEKILWWRVAREPYATPVFMKGFGKLLENLNARLPRGFYMAGNILTYPKSRNVNNAMESGKNAAEKIISSYGRK